MAPTLRSSNGPYFNTTRDTNPITTAAITVVAGDVVTLKVVTEDSSITPSAPSNTGVSCTWRLDATSGAVASNEYVVIYTTTVPSGGTITVSDTPTASNSGTTYKAMQCNVWSGAQLAATPATNATKTGSGAPSATLTTVAAGSIVDSVKGDWNTVSGARTYLSSATEEGNRNNGAIEACFFHQSAASAGSQTIGLSAPTGQAWAMVGIEIQALVVANPPPPSRRLLVAGRRASFF